MQFFVQCPSGNSRSVGAQRQGAVASRHETVVVRYTEGRADVKQGRIHFGVKFLYRDPEREGRKPKIKESSKGRFAIRVGYTQAFLIYTQVHSVHRHTDTHALVNFY